MGGAQLLILLHHQGASNFSPIIFLSADIIGEAKIIGTSWFELPDFAAPAGLLGIYEIPDDYLGQMVDAVEYRLKTLAENRIPFTWYLKTDPDNDTNKLYAIDVLVIPVGQRLAKVSVVSVSGPSGEVGDVIKSELVGKTFLYPGATLGVAFDKFVTQEVGTRIEGGHSDILIEYRNVQFKTGGYIPYP